MLKFNVVAAAIVGLILGVIAEFLFIWGNQIPMLGCLIGPVAFLFGLGLPILIGYLAAAWGSSRGLLTAPAGAVDGALAAVVAELASRLIGLCAALAAARSIFLGPRFLLPSVGPASRALVGGIWELGWLVVSLLVAALLGALGGMLYRLQARR